MARVSAKQTPSTLGGGTYGTVRKEGKYAVKTFKSVCSTIQEFTAFQCLRDRRSVLKAYSCDLRKKEVKMELGDLDLSKWLDRFIEPPDAIRWGILRDIVEGLRDIHELHLIHGDLKPSNIIIIYDKDHMPRAKIADLGFVSLAPYAKIKRTALAFRPEKIVHESGHDMFSLGVIIYELFSGGRKLSKKVSHKAMQDYALRHIKNKKARELAYLLTDRDYRKRPSATNILNTFFRTDLDTVSEWSGDLSLPGDWDLRASPSSSDSIEISTEFMKWVIRSMNVVSASINGISKARLKHGTKALLAFIARNGVIEADCVLYIVAMLLIVTSNFGPSGFTEVMCAEVCGRPVNELLIAVENLIRDEQTVDMIMAPY